MYNHIIIIQPTTRRICVNRARRRYQLTISAMCRICAANDYMHSESMRTAVN